MIAQTPAPPYFAVIFTSVRTVGDQEAYGAMARAMEDLARRQPGYLGHDSAREEVGITVSYWTDEASILAWKADADHTYARTMGRKAWYEHFTVRVAKVKRAYDFSRAIP